MPHKFDHTTVYGIVNCDTVKRARAWLDAQGVSYTFHDFKRAGVPAERLDHWLKVAGRDKLVNRQGLTWRRLDETTKTQAATDATARALLLAHASLIKRPVVEWADGALTVGFDEATWGLHAHR